MVDLLAETSLRSLRCCGRSHLSTGGYPYVSAGYGQLTPSGFEILKIHAIARFLTRVFQGAMRPNRRPLDGDVRLFFRLASSCHCVLFCLTPLWLLTDVLCNLGVVWCWLSSLLFGGQRRVLLCVHRIKAGVRVVQPYRVQDSLV